VEVTGELKPNMENHKVYEEMYQAYRSVYEGLASSGGFEKLAKIQTS
jgi:sugar (pentulose or hexulose) kinase